MTLARNRDKENILLPPVDSGLPERDPRSEAREGTECTEEWFKRRVAGVRPGDHALRDNSDAIESRRAKK